MKTAIESHVAQPSSREAVVLSKNIERNNKRDHTNESACPTLALQIQLPVASSSPSVALDAQNWDSVEEIDLASGATASKDELLETKELLTNLERSFTAMVMVFMISCLHLFSNFQKAQMAMAINQLETMIGQIKAQIAELKSEQQKQLMKDLFQAAAEMAGAVVTVVSAGATTKELSNKLDLQKANATNMKAAQINERIDQLQATGEAKNAQLRSHRQRAPRDGIQQVDSIIDETGNTLTRTRNEVNNANNSAQIQRSTHYESRDKLLSSEVSFIHNKQSLFSGVGALVKAIGPLAGGFLQNQATAHQIEAKAQEMAKEISSNQYRMLMELVAAFRDAFSRMINLLQEVLSQDPANSKASSQRMV